MKKFTHACSHELLINYYAYETIKNNMFIHLVVEQYSTFLNMTENDALYAHKHY